jgi:hypothetical protein
VADSGVTTGFSWGWCNACEWTGPERAFKTEADKDLDKHRREEHAPKRERPKLLSDKEWDKATAEDRLRTALTFLVDAVEQECRTFTDARKSFMMSMRVSQGLDVAKVALDTEGDQPMSDRSEP